jgi:PadR family transcriptional regulator, regulatory protein PadR
MILSPLTRLSGQSRSQEQNVVSTPTTLYTGPIAMTSITSRLPTRVAVPSSGNSEQTVSVPLKSISPCLPRAEVLVSVTEDIDLSKPSDLVQGTLDMLLLKILALEPMNGFAVSQRLRQVSGDILQVSDGSLYPALHKLEQAGWITAEWKTSEYGRRAKYYSLTRLGRWQLEKEAANWGRLSSAISRVIKLKEA